MQLCTFTPEDDQELLGVLASWQLLHRQGLESESTDTAVVSHKHVTRPPIAALGTMELFTYSTLCWRSRLYTSQPRIILVAAVRLLGSGALVAARLSVQADALLDYVPELLDVDVQRNG